MQIVVRATNPNQILIQVPWERDLCLPLPTPRLRPVLLLERGDCGPRLKIDQKPISFVDRFLIPSWLHLGSDLGAFGDALLESKSTPNPSKMLFQASSEHDVHGILVRSLMTFGPKIAPKTTQDGPRKDTRWT